MNLQSTVCNLQSVTQSPVTKSSIPAKPPDLGCRAAAGFDRPVHVSLPAQAGVLAAEDEAAERARQPGAQRGIERRIEIRVAAARPALLLPDDRPRGPQHRRLAEP